MRIFATSRRRLLYRTRGRVLSRASAPFADVDRRMVRRIVVGAGVALDPGNAGLGQRGGKLWLNLPAGLYSSVCQPAGADVKGIQDFALKTAKAALPPGSFPAGFTSPGVSFTPTALGIKPVKSEKGVKCRPEAVTASVTTEARYIKPGTHLIPNVVAEIPGETCGKKDQKLNLPVYAKVSKKISALAKKGELEHCNDFGFAFKKTVGKWAQEVNKLAKSGKVYGPAGSKQKCKDLIRKDLTKTLQGRLQEFAALAAKTDNRDKKGYHAFELDWDGSLEVKDKCSKIVVGIKKSDTNKIGEVKSKEIMK